jgi:hypothetical protein
MNVVKTKRWLTRQQQAERWSVHPRTVARWADDPEMDLPPEADFNGRMVRAEDAIELWEQARVRLRAEKRARTSQPTSTL